MKTIIVGLGNQGGKRLKVAGEEVVTTVDPFNTDAKFKDIKDVPLGDFDSALLCLPDDTKFEIIKYLLSNKKHVLVEKPLYSDSMTQSDLEELKKLAETNNTVCYTAYNHRFEPHFIKIKEILDQEELGKIYYIKMFYGNGTARLVRESRWRDSGMGVLPDLSVHMIDILKYWNLPVDYKFSILKSFKFENKSLDHVLISSNGDIEVILEMSLLSWRNHFVLDIIGEKGSLHMRDFCKWGESKLTVRKRTFPVGKPTEEEFVINSSDPTWEAEYNHFKALCHGSDNNIENDITYLNILKTFEAELS